MISHALRNLMEQCSDVFAMGHAAPDLDCMGSSLGICACARHVGKKAYIVMENPNPSIELLMERIQSTDVYSISNTVGAGGRHAHQPVQHAGGGGYAARDFTVSPRLLEIADTLVVIDTISAAHPASKTRRFFTTTRIRPPSASWSPS